ncbi:MAG: primosomal protein N' [Pseudomonadota bacterium]
MDFLRNHQISLLSGALFCYLLGMRLQKQYIETAVSLPVTKTFHYEVPEPFQERIEIGHRVWVPFGSQQITGYVLDFSRPPCDTSIKKILDVLDDTPLFPAHMVSFYRWIARYYLHPIGEVIKGGLPGGINTAVVQTVSLTEKGKAAMRKDRNQVESKILELLKENDTLTLKGLDQRMGHCVPRSLIYGMVRAGSIALSRKITPGRVSPKWEWYVTAKEEVAIPGRFSQSRQKLLDAIKTKREISLKALKEIVPTAGRLVRLMAEDGLVEMVKRPVYRDPFGEPIEGDIFAPELMPEQAKAVFAIKEGLTRGGFETYLLHGVTGSGKTEVYMRAVADVLEMGKEALVLVPEIALISQTERRFRARFGDRVALLHSGLTDGERYDQWMRIRKKEAGVVIGARSAVFAPLENLGLVVVDEEHDDSYKQESGLRYNGRDLAIVRAKIAGAVAMLGSATPSLSSYHNSLTGKSHRLTLSKRVREQALPEVTVVDLRKQEGRRRNIWFLSRELKEAIKTTLDRGEQILLFLNRRGYASFPMCAKCGKAVRCKNCDVSLTFHQGANAFRCHYCGFSRPGISACEGCGSEKTILLGLGTEKVEAAMKELFPEARVARMDRDTTSQKGALLKQLKALRKGAVDILIGTQMVAKGHDFPGITLVGIVCADLSLNFPDFRAAERTFQILSQVAGRAGRGDRPGKVILQTYNPEHFCILTARDQDCEAFYKEETPFREALGYPPFSRLVQLIILGSDRKKTFAAAQLIGKICKALQAEDDTLRKEITVLGPVAAPISRLQKKYRCQLLLKGLRAGSLHALVTKLMKGSEKAVREARVKVVVDVDPVSML